MIASEAIAKLQQAVLMDDATQTYVEATSQATAAASAAFDKAVAAIAAGALGLSITFIHSIAPDPTNVGRIALSWTFLTAALLSSMFSFLTSEHAHRAILRRLRQGDSLSEVSLGGWGIATHVLNVASACLTTLGVAFLAYFTFGNPHDRLKRPVDPIQHSLVGNVLFIMVGDAVEQVDLGEPRYEVQRFSEDLTAAVLGHDGRRDSATAGPRSPSA